MWPVFLWRADLILQCNTDWDLFLQARQMPSGLASHSLLCMCHLHMTEATDAYLSMLFFPRKCFMEMPVENTTQDEYSCQLVPQELLRASSPLLSISFSLAARNHMEILFLIRGHVWKASAELCEIIKSLLCYENKVGACFPPCVIFAHKGATWSIVTPVSYIRP